MSNIKEGLLYSKDHEWVKIEGDTAFIGITDYAQDALGEIVYVELPECDDFDEGEEVSTIESVKTASPVFAPISGNICETNEKLDESPELINEDCYSAWIFKMENIEVNEETLMDAKAYASFLETL